MTDTGRGAAGSARRTWIAEVAGSSPAAQTTLQACGYPTQKPVALYERIVRASSDNGDVVLDPFCGSGTTLVAAKRLGRRWIGIDANADAIAIAEKRLAKELV